MVLCHAASSMDVKPSMAMTSNSDLVKDLAYFTIHVAYLAIDLTTKKEEIPLTPRYTGGGHYDPP